MALSWAPPDLEHAFEELVGDNLINLKIGAPGPDILKRLPALMQAATARRLDIERDSGFLFQYGPNAGHTGYRQQMAGFLSKRYKSRVDPANLILTCGATHGLCLAASILLSGESVLFVEAATYFIAIKIFADFNFRVVPVDLAEDDGLDVVKLRSTVANVFQHKKKTEGGRFWAMMYLIPTFHNPTGRVLSAEASRQVVSVAREFDVLVVCDDVYNLLSYRAEGSPARLFAYDRSDDPNFAGGHVISNGSLSKVLSPGLRVGWMEAPCGLARRLHDTGLLLSGGSVNNYTAGVVASAIEMGLVDRHLDQLVAEYEQRMRLVCRLLADSLPENCVFSPPDGGYFVWVRRKDGGLSKFCDWLQEADFGEEKRVLALSGVKASAPYSLGLDSSSYADCMRLCIAYYPSELLAEGVKLLCDRLKTYVTTVESA